MKVLAAMSGGVDSAALPRHAQSRPGMMSPVFIWPLSKNPQSYRSGARGCCSKRGCPRCSAGRGMCSGSRSTYGICSDRFAADVVSDFVAEYAAGRTLNPRLRCNEKIKFSAVLDRGVALSRFRCGLHWSLRPADPFR